MANSPGPDLGAVFTISRRGSSLPVLDLAGVEPASAFSFSATDLLIPSTRASNCSCVIPAGGAGAESARAALMPRTSRTVSARARRIHIVVIVCPLSRASLDPDQGAPNALSKCYATELKVHHKT